MFGGKSLKPAFIFVFDHMREHQEVPYPHRPYSLELRINKGRIHGDLNRDCVSVLHRNIIFHLFHRIGEVLKNVVNFAVWERGLNSEVYQVALDPGHVRLDRVVAHAAFALVQLEMIQIDLSVALTNIGFYHLPGFCD